MKINVTEEWVEHDDAPVYRITKEHSKSERCESACIGHVCSKKEAMELYDWYYDGSIMRKPIGTEFVDGAYFEVRA